MPPLIAGGGTAAATVEPNCGWNGEKSRRPPVGMRPPAIAAAGSRVRFVAPQSGLGGIVPTSPPVPLGVTGRRGLGAAGRDRDGEERREDGARQATERVNRHVHVLL